MLESISGKQFSTDQLLSDQQAQQVFGGTWQNTLANVHGGWHFDAWNDWDADLSWGFGDTLTVYIGTPPPDGSEPIKVPYTMAQLEDRGVIVNYE